MSDLARVIRDNAGGVRKYLILDCCFSARAFKDFQSTAKEVMLAKTGEILSPSTGTTMLCSSSAQNVSKAPEGATYTMFSGALLRALREGMPRVNRRISMAQLGRQVGTLIREQYSDEAVRPEVLSPDQREDELKDLPLFPNAALKMQNFDCTITVLDRETVALECKNEQGRPERIEGKLGDPIAMLTVQRLHQWINLGLALEQDQTWRTSFSESTDGSLKLRSIDDMRVLGMSLFRVLFGDDKLRDSFCRVYSRFQTAVADKTNPGLRMRLRLAFRRQAEEVARLPWEFLFVPEADQSPFDRSFFAGRRSELVFTRHALTAARAVQLKSEPLRILVAVYTPGSESGIGPIELEGFLAKLRAIPNTQVSVVQDASLAMLGKKLENETPHVFHFIGYGTKDERGGLTFVGRQEDPENRAYETQEKTALPQRGDEVFTLFSYDAKPGMVFLHGCKTSGNPLDAFQRQEGLKKCALELVSLGIATVVTMQFAIANEEVGDFAVAAYAELAKGNGPDEAVMAGRIALGQIFPKWSHPRFGAPLVLLQNDDPLVSPPAVPETTRDKTEATKGERELAPAGGSAVGAAAPRPGTAETPSESAPASAPRDRTSGDSSFQSR